MISIPLKKKRTFLCRPARSKNRVFPGPQSLIPFSTSTYGSQSELEHKATAVARAIERVFNGVGAQKYVILEHVYDRWEDKVRFSALKSNGDKVLILKLSKKALTTVSKTKIVDAYFRFSNSKLSDFCNSGDFEALSIAKRQIQTV